MAITASLRFAGKNRLRYLVTATAGAGETVAIDGAGGVTPDLLTDARTGGALQLIQILLACVNGYGKITAGTTVTQAISRALLLSDDSVSVVGNGKPVALVQLLQRSSAADVGGFKVDSDTSSTLIGGVELNVTAGTVGTCYIDLFLAGAPGA